MAGFVMDGHKLCLAHAELSQDSEILAIVHVL